MMVPLNSLSIGHMFSGIYLSILSVNSSYVPFVYAEIF